MNALAFDTHKAVKALKEAGADERLAEAVVATVGDAMGENVATKADIAAVRSDVTGVRSDIATEIAGVRSEIAGVRIFARSEIRILRHLWMPRIVGLIETSRLTDPSLESRLDPRDQDKRRELSTNA